MRVRIKFLSDNPKLCFLNINHHHMKRIIFLLICQVCFLAAFTQTTQEKKTVPDPNKKLQIVETSCGECKFGLKGKSCDLAVRIAGKAYFVSGTSIDEHGDAHDKDGFCNAIRKAEVQGEVVNGKFVVSYFKLLPVEKKE